MTKLVSRNPILRFKEGRKIKMYQSAPGPLTTGDTHYIGTRGRNKLFTQTVNGLLLKSRDDVRKYQRDVLGFNDKDSDGIWGEKTQTAYDKQFPYKTGTLSSNGQFTPNGRGYSDIKEALHQSAEDLVDANIAADALKVREVYKPEAGIYSPEKEFVGRDLRKSAGYSDIGSYYDWLNSDAGKQSEDYKVLGNLGIWNENFDENKRREAFNSLMSNYGIEGTFRRGNFRRLARLLNDSRRLATDDTMRNNYTSAYNTAFDDSWDKTKKMFTSYYDLLRNGAILKQGGLIPRKAVDQFKLRRRNF